MLKLTVRERIRSTVPWWAKGALKLALAKMPVGYSVLRTVGLAQHGGMERPEWAYETFHRHYDGVDFHRKGDGFTALELGPGDSLFMALIAKAHGASGTCHVDVGPFVNGEVRLYRKMAAYLQGLSLPCPDLSMAQSVDEVLALCHARYETRGLASLRAIPDASVDFVFSNGVLQSVWRDELPATLAELRRIMHPKGVSVHSVDLRDTMGHSLHHLKFSERLWESDWFRNAGFYTNRVRLSEMTEMARQAGFEVEVAENNRWPALPVPRRKMAAPYRDMPEADLLAATVRIVFRAR